MPGDRTGDERAREGLVHLQAATLEVIAAARAFLDVAEGLAREPGALAAIADAAVAVVRAAAPAPRGAGAAPPEEGGRESGGAGGRGAGGDEPPSGVTRIRLS